MFSVWIPSFSFFSVGDIVSDVREVSNTGADGSPQLQQLHFAHTTHDSWPFGIYRTSEACEQGVVVG